MSIRSIGNYKLIEEETNDPYEIAAMAYTLMIDLGSDEALTKRFVEQLEEPLEDASAVSFVTAYKNYVVPHNLAGVALIKWLEPETGTPSLAASDFCEPLFIAQKAIPVFVDAASVLEDFIRVEAEARLYAHNFKDMLL